MINKLGWTNEKVKSIKTNKYGRGNFALKNIKKDEILAIIGGHILTLEEEKKLPSDYGDNGLQIAENKVICNLGKNEPNDNFNHSCEPNAGIHGQINIVAMRDIKKGEEITFDYAMCLYHQNKKDTYKMVCLCGTKKCRKVITSNDWKISELQEKYDGYFQLFLQKKINQLKK